jgi:hypothetical protein
MCLVKTGVVGVLFVFSDYKSDYFLSLWLQIPISLISIGVASEGVFMGFWRIVSGHPVLKCKHVCLSPWWFKH